MIEKIELAVPQEPGVTVFTVPDFNGMSPFVCDDNSWKKCSWNSCVQGTCYTQKKKFRLLLTIELLPKQVITGTLHMYGFEPVSLTK